MLACLVSAGLLLAMPSPAVPRRPLARTATERAG
jgi:hypothetical protein